MYGFAIRLSSEVVSLFTFCVLWSLGIRSKNIHYLYEIYPTTSQPLSPTCSESNISIINENFNYQKEKFGKYGKESLLVPTGGRGNSFFPPGEIYSPGGGVASDKSQLHQMSCLVQRHLSGSTFSCFPSIPLIFTVKMRRGITSYTWFKNPANWL